MAVIIPVGNNIKHWVDYRNETLNCPYCKKEIVDAWEVPIGYGHTYECPHCEKEFEFDSEPAAVYTTYRKQEATK